MPTIPSENCEEALRHFDYIGQRADKLKVESVTEDGYKEIEYYTMTCPDCAGIGYYEEGGEVICEDCGMVISGNRRAAFPTERGPEHGRGWSTDGDGYRGSKEPLV